MSTKTLIPDRKLNTLTFSSLPYEIRHEILYHLLIESSPIKIHEFSRLDGTSKNDPLQSLRTMNFTPEACEIFYRHNTFYVAEEYLQLFLDYDPTRPTDSDDKDQSRTPKPHIRHLIFSIQPHMRFARRQDHDPGPDLRRVLEECPNLEKLEISIFALFEGLCEFDGDFIKIAAICVELMEKMGEENVEVKVRYLRGERIWTLADFRTGKPPEGWP